MHGNTQFGFENLETSRMKQLSLEQLASPNTLLESARAVITKRGAAGPDGISVTTFAANLEAKVGDSTAVSVAPRQTRSMPC
jgi:hypothetical protein